MTSKKETRGGKRPNAGRKPSFSEPTKVLRRQIPVSKYDDVTEVVDALLKSYQK